MHVVNQNCLGCKFGDCVEVCPVRGCFKIGANMVVIDPNLCIDCRLCVDACPANAIAHDSKSELKWISHNAKYAKEWPTIDYPDSMNIKLPTADDMKNNSNKEQIFDATKK